MNSTNRPPRGAIGDAEVRYRVLTREHIQQIDDLLASLGEYGEVHLIIQRGQLRYVNRVESHKAWGDLKNG